MRHLITALLVMWSLVTTSQVITSLGQQNMKIPKMPKDDEKHPDLPAVVDTTSLYFTLIDSAQVYINNKQWQRAEHFLTSAIECEPGNPNNSLLLSNLATIQRFDGRNGEAIANYTRALEITPNAVTLLHNRAALFLETGDVEAAKRDFEHIISIDPTDVDSRYNLGLLAMDDGDVATAKTSFEAIQRIDPSSPLAAEGLATLYKALGQLDVAIGYYDKALKGEKTVALLANRADCHLALGHLNDAENDIHDAIELDPNDGFLHLLNAKLSKLRFDNDGVSKNIQLAIDHGVDPAIAKQLLQLN